MNDILISDDKQLLDIELIHNYLCDESYWANGIGLDVVTTSIDHSLCMGIYLNKKQIGFCRMITDYSTFGYLGDVFILDDYRGFGYSKLLVEKMMEHEKLQGIRRFMLATFDAHNLYAKFEFTPLKKSELFMEKHNADIYQNNNN